MVMFKKGQLVKAKRGGQYAIVKRVSSKVPGSCYLTHPEWCFDMWFHEDELKLIGNNFKFKGAE